MPGRKASKDKRSLGVDDSASSRGADVSKKPKPSAAAENATPSPAATASSSDGDKLVFPCASCAFETSDDQEFIKHTRADHRGELSLWCKLCGKCFGNAGFLVSHIKEKRCKAEEMIYRCGVKDCSFETPTGAIFVQHLRHCHKGSTFMPCLHCQKMFTLPHCLVLHMQDECPHKDKNRKNPGSDSPAANDAPVTPATPPVAVKPQAPSFSSKTPVISSVVSKTPPAGRGRGRGKGRRRPPSESSDSDDADDPFFKPEETAGGQNLRRSGRIAKKD